MYDRFLADLFVESTCPHPGCGYADACGDQCSKLVNATELIRPRCPRISTVSIYQRPSACSVSGWIRRLMIGP
ncbi:probable methionine--tRNA ligase, cytoplasmic [Drosophila persimilis]|uniref:probable methionine--tRNA ligase, cytoplasmic n=1 Tax=Drosophila persimilis TaxID=7234 RepID=UPI000F08B273|nr:probable methionine--tRNA ligase, cytoplasmic [Drosophila persimilis]